MNGYECWEIAGHTLEYLNDEHLYLCDGVILPSITQALKVKFGGKYAAVDKETLKRAADMGTAVHEAIEAYCKTGAESDLPELKNFKFLQKKYGFEVLANEIPVILFKEGKDPIFAGRLDMVITMNGEYGLADIKRTSSLDKEYLGYQLNLYRVAYFQSYGQQITFLRGLHLREDVRKFVTIFVNERAVKEVVEAWEKGDTNGNIQG